MAAVEFTEHARDDLRDIHAFVARDSAAAAEALVARILAASDRLGDFPESGRLVPEFPAAGYREILVGAYRVIYKPVAERVIVGAVVHGMRLLEAPPATP